MMKDLLNGKSFARVVANHAKEEVSGFEAQSRRISIRQSFQSLPEEVISLLLNVVIKIINLSPEKRFAASEHGYEDNAARKYI